MAIHFVLLEYNIPTLIYGYIWSQTRRVIFLSFRLWYSDCISQAGFEVKFSFGRSVSEDNGELNEGAARLDKKAVDRRVKVKAVEEWV